MHRCNAENSPQFTQNVFLHRKTQEARSGMGKKLGLETHFFFLFFFFFLSFMRFKQNKDVHLMHVYTTIIINRKAWCNAQVLC